MPQEKQVNYSEETVKRMIDVYQSADGEEGRAQAMLEIQEFTGKSIPSIRSKLATEGVYIAKKPAVSKSERVTKADLVNQIADRNPDQVAGFFDSLEGVNKTVLEFILKQQPELVSADESAEASE